MGDSTKRPILVFQYFNWNTKSYFNISVIAVFKINVALKRHALDCYGLCTKSPILATVATWGSVVLSCVIDYYSTDIKV